MIRFPKYVRILICLIRVVALCYNLVCTQMFSLNFNPLNNILGSYKQTNKQTKNPRKILFN